MGKSNNTILGIVGTLAVVLAVVVILFATGVFDKDELSIGGASGGTGSTVNIINERGEVVPIEPDNIDLDDLYNDNFGTYVDLREADCNAAGGTWVEEADRIGCYAVPVWNNTAHCTSTEVRILKLLCTTVAGTWTCDTHEVSCEN